MSWSYGTNIYPTNGSTISATGGFSIRILSGVCDAEIPVSRTFTLDGVAYTTNITVIYNTPLYTVWSIYYAVPAGFLGYGLHTWHFTIDSVSSPTYSFTVSLPSKATNPTPTNAASDVTLDQQTITWENGGGATSYNVYYGTQSGNLTLVATGQAGISFTVYQITNGSPFDYAITRYWRIDSINTAGTTTGDEWSFTTIVFDYPPGGARGVGGGYGGDDGSGEATGYGGGTFGDAQVHIKTRLIGFANNKLWYESL